MRWGGWERWKGGVPSPSPRLTAHRKQRTLFPPGGASRQGDAGAHAGLTPPLPSITPPHRHGATPEVFPAASRPPHQPTHPPAEVPLLPAPRGSPPAGKKRLSSSSAAWATSQARYAPSMPPAAAPRAPRARRCCRSHAPPAAQRCPSPRGRANGSTSRPRRRARRRLRLRRPPRAESCAVCVPPPTPPARLSAPPLPAPPPRGWAQVRGCCSPPTTTPGRGSVLVCPGGANHQDPKYRPK